MEIINGKNYVSPQDDKFRIGLDIDGLQEFELVEVQSSGKLEGRLPKRFVRLSSNYFSNYIREIQNNPNSSYETFLDNEEIRKGNIPNNFSVLLKFNHNDLAFVANETNDILSHIKAELCAPVIMNELGVKTVYNSILVETSGYAQYVMSIDAIKSNEETFVLNDFISCDFSGWIESGMDIVGQYATFLLERECGLTKEELSTDKYKKMIEELKDEFIVRYLANIVLLGNNDYNARNYALLVNKKTKQVRTFPCFDYEFCFNGCYLKEGVRENFELIMKYKPKILIDFAQKMKALTEIQKSGKTRLQEVIAQVLPEENENSFYYYILNKNIETFFEIYEQVLDKEKTNPDQLTIF